MITKEEHKLIIEIMHPCPEDFRTDLKEAIIGAIQYQNTESAEAKTIHFVNCTLLELLKNLD
jgi:DNA-binding cell septation regulator SpoVG